MGKLDFIVMVVFALLIFAIGLTFTRSSSKSGNAFFEAGGETPWWINGLSLFISYFSAGTFVVWGSIAYSQGLVANVIQLTMAISGLIVTLVIAAKWKRTGVATAAEFISKRFGSKEKQFYTYLTLLLSLFTTAAVLYPVGKMVYVATPFTLNQCIVGIGLIIVLYTAAGGLWAVLVTDVVQFVILTAAVIIVIPIALGHIGGINTLYTKAPEGFFKPFSVEYSFEFMLAFVVYQTFYIGGNWAYVQRYTSVSTEKNARKVSGIFTALYLICPVIWMLPPMIYRIINPNLTGLETEGAYMMLIQSVMPAGLIGLVLAGMISATSSKANTTINMAATVFAQDIYKNLIRPAATEKEVIFMARFFTMLFGIGTIVVAIWIPSAGGIVEVVLSTASIAGGALFAPIIWSLYSKRTSGYAVVSATILSLVINLFFKVGSPVLLDFKFSRAMETAFGMGIPVAVMLVFELYFIYKGRHSVRALEMEFSRLERLQAPAVHLHQDAVNQNMFGIKVIGISMLVVGLGISLLGYLAPRYSAIVITVGIVIFLLSLLIIYASRKKQEIMADYAHK